MYASGLTNDPAYTLVRAETQSGKDLNGIPPELKWSHTTKAFADYQVSEGVLENRGSHRD